jgi:hypothetical protein
MVTILDIFGNKIIVTNIREATLQAGGGRGIDNVNFTPHIKDEYGFNKDISGREHESITAGQYWTDMHMKLLHLAKGHTVTCTLECNSNGYDDYTIINQPLVKRLCVPFDVKEGDLINTYYGESSKMTIPWKNDVITTILNGYKTYAICEGVVLDDMVIESDDDRANWTQVCESCQEKHPRLKRFVQERAPGICGVQGCNNPEGENTRYLSILKVK